MEIYTTLIWEISSLENLESFYSDMKWEAKSLLGTFYITRDKTDKNDYSIYSSCLPHVLSTNTLEDAKRMAQDYYDMALKRRSKKYHQTSQKHEI